MVVEIFPGSSLPYSLKSMGEENGVYIRVGSTNRKADRNRIEELKRRKQNISFDETLLYDMAVEELDIERLTSDFSF